MFILRQSRQKELEHDELSHVIVDQRFSVSIFGNLYEVLLLS